MEQLTIPQITPKETVLFLVAELAGIISKITNRSAENYDKYRISGSSLIYELSTVFNARLINAPEVSFLVCPATADFFRNFVTPAEIEDFLESQAENDMKNWTAGLRDMLYEKMLRFLSSHTTQSAEFTRIVFGSVAFG